MRTLKKRKAMAGDGISARFQYPVLTSHGSGSHGRCSKRKLDLDGFAARVSPMPQPFGFRSSAHCPGGLCPNLLLVRQRLRTRVDSSR
jgi:hypothetical protein